MEPIIGSAGSSDWTRQLEYKLTLIACEPIVPP
jgi:hypothetical protein